MYCFLIIACLFTYALNSCENETIFLPLCLTPQNFPSELLPYVKNDHLKDVNKPFCIPLSDKAWSNEKTVATLVEVLKPYPNNLVPSNGLYYSKQVINKLSLKEKINLINISEFLKVQKLILNTMIESLFYAQITEQDIEDSDHVALKKEYLKKLIYCLKPELFISQQFHPKTKSGEEEGLVNEIRSCHWNEEQTFFATNAFDGKIRIFNFLTGKRRKKLSSDGPCAWHPTQSSIAFSADKKIKIWDHATDSIRTCAMPKFKQTDGVTALAWHPVKDQLSAFIGVSGYCGKLCTWNSITGKIIAVSSNEKMYPTSLAYHPEGDKVAVSNYNSIEIIDPLKGERHHRYDTGNQIAPRPISWNQKGNKLIVLGCNDQKIINSNTGKECLALTDKENDYFNHNTVGCAAGSPDNTCILTGAHTVCGIGSEKKVQLLDAMTGFRLLSLKSPDVTAVSWSPKQDYIACGYSGGWAKVWKLPDSTMSLKKALRLLKKQQQESKK